jgi:uncharacterized membrane protein
VPLVIAKESVRVSFGPAAFLGGMEPTAIFYQMMSYLDLFAIWGIIATGFGYAAVFGLSRGKGMAVSVLSWIIVMGCFLALTVVGMMLGGVKITFF